MSQIDRVPCPICGGPREILMETNHAQHIYCAECDRETMRTHELVTAETRMKGYIHAPDWCRKEMLGSICWLIFMHGVAWPFAGILVAAFFYFWKVGNP